MPAGAQAHEGFGRHELAVVENLATDDDCEAGPADDPLVRAAYLWRLRMAQDALPAAQDIAPLVQGALAGRQADHRPGGRPQLLHGFKVPVVEGAVEGAIGC